MYSKSSYVCKAAICRVASCGHLIVGFLLIVADIVNLVVTNDIDNFVAVITVVSVILIIAIHRRVAQLFQCRCTFFSR